MNFNHVRKGWERFSRVRAIRYLIDLQRRYSQDDAGTLVNAIAFQAFLSIFPVLLLGLAILGFALSGNPSLQGRILGALSKMVPGLNLPERGIQTLIRHRLVSTIVAVFGLAWSGRSLVNICAHSLNKIFRRKDPSGWNGLIRPFLWMTVLGSVFIVSAVSGAFLLRGAWWLGAPIVLAVDFGLFMIAYRMLTYGPGPSFAQLWPGALSSAISWGVIRVAGVWYVARTVRTAHPIYGSFAATVGLLALLALAAQLFLYGAEIDAMRIDRSHELTRSAQH